MKHKFQNLDRYLNKMKDDRVEFEDEDGRRWKIAKVKTTYFVMSRWDGQKMCRQKIPKVNFNYKLC